MTEYESYYKSNIQLTTDIKTLEYRIFAVYENNLFALTSEANESQEFVQGMNVDCYDMLTGNVVTKSYTSYEFKEPEGAIVLDGYLCISLVNKGGFLEYADCHTIKIYHNVNNNTSHID